jgi:hypothetical protein
LLIFVHFFRLSLGHRYSMLVNDKAWLTSSFGRTGLAQPHPLQASSRLSVRSMLRSLALVISMVTAPVS